MEPTWQGTVLLADVRGDAATLYAAAGAAKALQAIKECISLLERACWEGGATLVKTHGDGLMALFPSPVAAADAATAIQVAVYDLPAVADTKIGVRVAFQSGPVTVRNGEVLGQTVSIASSLIEGAQREQIITSRDTAQALGHTYKNRMRTMRPARPIENMSSLALCEFVWRVSENTTRLGMAEAKPVRHESIRLAYGITELASKGEYNPISLGRDFECGLIILDDLASRRHATIEMRAGEFVLTDHSTNGTYVTEEGGPEIYLRHTDFTLRRHGWITCGQPRERSDQVVEYFCS